MTILRPRVAGAGHSTLYSNVFTQESRCKSPHHTQPLVPTNLSYNPKFHTVTVGSGALLRDIERFTGTHGRRVVGMPEVSTITVGGAVSVGAHGGGLRHGTLSSQIKRLWVYSGSGYVTAVRRKVAVARCCLGMRGVISHVEFYTKPLVMYRTRTRYCTGEPATDKHSCAAESHARKHSCHSYLFTQLGTCAVTTVEEVPYCGHHPNRWPIETVVKNTLIDAYRTILAHWAVLRLVSLLINLFPRVALVLVEFDVATKVLFGTEVRRSPFSIVPSSEAYTLECGVDTRHARRATRDFRRMLVDLRKGGHYVSYRSWCRFVKHDRNTRYSISSKSDVLAFEVTLDRNQRGHRELMDKFRLFRQKYEGRPHLGKTVLKKDLKYVGRVYDGFKEVDGDRRHLTRSMRRIVKA